MGGVKYAACLLYVGKQLTIRSNSCASLGELPPEWMGTSLQKGNALPNAPITQVSEYGQEYEDDSDSADHGRFLPGSKRKIAMDVTD